MAFHVPEKHRMLDGPLKSDATYGNNGAFAMPSCEKGWGLILICSDQEGWEHVSVQAVSQRGLQPYAVLARDVFS